MPVIVVTRLRLKETGLLDEFFTAAAGALDQALKSDGNLGADALADADNTWWSVSSWQERGPMQAFVRSEPHLSTMGKLDHLCDEATFVDWEQAGPDLPDWQTSYRQPEQGLPPAGRAGCARYLSWPQAWGCIRDSRPMTSAPTCSPSSADTAGWTSMSKTSLHSSSTSITGPKLSAEKIVTTCTAEAVGQYSAMGRMPSGYFHPARRISAASRSAAVVEERKVSNAT